MIYSIILVINLFWIIIFLNHLYSQSIRQFLQIIKFSNFS